MYECYLDDSGTSDSSIVTLAGFVARHTDWLKFELSWEDVLSGANVEVLHTKEFHDTKPPFKGWSRLKKRDFVDSLFAIAAGKMGGISASVRISDIKKTKIDIQKLHQMSPICVSFGLILAQVYQKICRDPSFKGLSVFVEAGNKNNKEIEKYFNNISNASIFEGKLKSIQFINKNHCRAIQIADFLAFYSRRHMQRFDKYGKAIILPSCQFLDIIERHVPIWARHFSGMPQFPGVNVKDFQTVEEMRLALTKQEG